MNYLIQYWTIKEAFLKAKGTGLNNHINQIDTNHNRIYEEYLASDFFYQSFKIIPEHYLSICVKKEFRDAVILYTENYHGIESKIIQLI